jgi:phosphonate transport system ATP-binding protein
MIELKSTTVTFGDTAALKNINLSINNGDKIGIIGPSGAGKTSLLRKLYETALADEQAEPGFIHQDFALVEQLSVFHNVYMGRLDKFSLLKNIRNFLLPAKEMQHEILLILEQLQLHDKLHTKAGELSGGQKQRLAIARCLFKSPALILADEPVSSVDPRQAETVLNILLNAAPAVLVSLHTTDMALRLCKRLIALRDGRIVFDGRPDDLSEAQLSELFKP